MLAKKERRVLDLLSYAWNVFCELEEVHPDHADEFRHAIHEAERIVLVREAKEMPDIRRGAPIRVEMLGVNRPFLDAIELAKFMQGSREFTAKHEEAIVRADNLCRGAGGRLCSRETIASILIRVDESIGGKEG